MWWGTTTYICVTPTPSTNKQTAHHKGERGVHQHICVLPTDTKVTTLEVLSYEYYRTKVPILHYLLYSSHIYRRVDHTRHPNWTHSIYTEQRGVDVLNLLRAHQQHKITNLLWNGTNMTKRTDIFLTLPSIEEANIGPVDKFKLFEYKYTHFEYDIVDSVCWDV